MEFDDMQVIWNSEKQEKMFTIDEAALRAMVERKGKVIAQMMQNVEWIFIAGNFLIALFLLYKMISEDYTVYAYIMPLLYFGYSIYMLVRKRNRKHEQSQVYFAETMVGEIDKALWQIDYLLKQYRSMMVWYVVPLAIAAIVFRVLNAPPFWGIALIVVVVPLSYFASNWEIKRFYLPKKRELESLRKKITTEV